jgi:hypothetical protein
MARMADYRLGNLQEVRPANIGILDWFVWTRNAGSLFRHILPTEASSLPNQLCRMWEVVAYKMGYLLVSSPEDP